MRGSPILYARGFVYRPKLTPVNGLPSISRSKYVFTPREIPVVLLTNVRGLGQKGDIRQVPRGVARHSLIPKKLAVYGTLWENIDQYARTSLDSNERGESHEAQESDRSTTFGYLHGLKVNLTREVQEVSSWLQTPVSLWEVLEELSVVAEVDLCPDNLVDFPESIQQTGEYPLSISLNVRGKPSVYRIVLVVVAPTDRLAGQLAVSQFQLNTFTNEPTEAGESPETEASPNS